MTPSPSAGERGVEWLVLWIKQVPVCDQHGYPLAEPWNPRVPLRAPRVKVIDRLYAPTKQDALEEAHRRFPPNDRNEIEVQSAVSYAIEQQDREVVAKSRISPAVATTSQRRFRYPQLVR